MDKLNISMIAKNHLISKVTGFAIFTVSLLSILFVIFNEPFPTLNIVRDVNLLFCSIILLVSAYRPRFSQLIINILIFFIFTIALIALLMLPAFNITVISKVFYPLPMSLFSNCLFLLVCFAFCVKKPAIRQLITAAIILIALFDLVAYILGVGGFTKPPFATDEAVHMTLQGACLFFLLGIGILFLDPSYGFVKLYLSNSGGGVFTRRLIPFIIIVPIVIAYIRNIGLWAGIYSFEIGVTLLVFTTITLLILFTIYSAAKINKLDTIRWREQLFLQSIMDNMASAFFVKDTQGKYILVNKAYGTIININSKDILGKTDLEIYPEIYAKEFILNDEKVIQERKSMLVEEKLIIDNEERTSLSVKFPVLDENNKITAIAGIAIDITDKKKEIEQKKRNEEDLLRLANIVNSSSDCIISKTLEGTIISWNPAAEKLYGYKHEEAIGHSIYLIVPDDEKNEIPFIMRSVQNGNVITNVETKRKHKNGKLISVLITFFPIKDTRGKVVAICSSTRDISKQKQQESELTLLNNKLTAIMNGSSHAIISVDLNGIIQVFNPAAENMLGYEANEVVGKVTPVIIHDLDEIKNRAETLTKLLRRPIQPSFEVFVANLPFQDVDEGEWTYIRKDGSRVPVFLSVSALRDSHHKTIGYVGIARDITEQKKADIIKNEFISVVSHELKTPLTSIQGSLDLLYGIYKESANEDVNALFDIAKNNSARLIRLINDILDIDKIESGKMMFDMHPINIADVVKDAIFVNQTYADKFNVKLVLRKVFVEARVNGDPDKLQQVMANLLSNAIKFSTAGAEVIVDVVKHDSVVRVSVLDRGCGISESFKPKVFQKFAQADSSAIRTKGGTGLGLSISKAIIEKLGGMIGFKSNPKFGTTFYFDLPLLK